MIQASTPDQLSKDMASIRRTNKEIKTTVGGGSIQYDVTVPKGTICRDLGGRWVVDQLAFLDKSSGAYHDAHYRGITVNEEDLEDSPKG